MSEIILTREQLLDCLHRCTADSGNCCLLYNAPIESCTRVLLKAATAALEATPAAWPVWIPVTERLPESSKRVIVVRPGKEPEQGVYLGVNGWWKIYGANTKAVTHWCPMPVYTPPATE